MSYFGQSTIITALDEGVEIPNALAYVWRFWDGSCKVTVRGATQKVVNRAAPNFAVEAFDSLGQVSDASVEPLAVKEPPKLNTNELGLGTGVLPFTINFSVFASSTEDDVAYSWYAENGELLATGSDVELTVTANGQSFQLIVAEAGDANSKSTYTFVVQGITNTPPRLSGISTAIGVKPWKSVVAPVYVTTTAQLTWTAGSPTVDGKTIPASWKLVDDVWTKVAASRVLVRHQGDTARNGIYTASTVTLPYNFTSGSGITSTAISLGDGLITISATNADSVDCAAPLADLLSVGVELALFDGSVLLRAYEVTAVEVEAGGYTVTVTELYTSGSTAAAGTLRFGWRKVTLTNQATVRVISGTAYAGSFFTASVSGAETIFARADASYGGCSQRAGRRWIEAGIRDRSGLAGTLSADYLGTTFGAVYVGDSDALMRVKAATENLTEGSYSANTRAVQLDTGVDGFVQLEAAARAIVPVTASCPLPSN